MNEHLAYLLVRIETMTDADRRTADEVAAQLTAQTTRRLPWRRRRVTPLPRPRRASPAL